MKTIRFVFIIFVIFLTTSCTKDFPEDETPLAPGNTTDELKCKPHQLKIAVISDIHYLAPALLKNGAEHGEAFLTYLNYDPKLIEFSDPIFKKAISRIKRDRPDIVLIPGDLTKDGEKVSHEAVARILHQLTDLGIKVFVVPGNHDINNPEAVLYDGNYARSTPKINAREFAKIYGAFGYKNALSRDANSLSYICQPFRGLWILAMDDCEYYDNTNSALVPGKIKPETMDWIVGKLCEAKQKNITVLSMMHHGIMEHFTGQETLDPGYVTDDWQNQADKLMKAGLKVMFTGHYHANDIAMLSSGENVLYDIETGSLVTPPSPYRMITLSNAGMNITTNKITAINCAMPGGLSFTDYSNAFLTAHMDGYFKYVFTSPAYGLDEATAEYLAPYFRDGWMAHYAGDELMPPEVLEFIGGLPPPLDGALYSIWTDLTPADNLLHIDLN